MSASRSVLWFLMSLAVWVGCGDNYSAQLGIDPPSITVMVGEDQTISARRAGEAVSGVTWTSSDDSIARVTAGGESATVRGVKPGTASITATLGGVAATATVTVTPAGLQSIAITPPAPSLAAGTLVQLTAT